MKQYIVIFLLFIPCVFLGSFKTLQEVIKYADAYQQSPPFDNNAWLDQDYSSYHISIRDSLFQKILRYLPLGKNMYPFFDTDYFLFLLDVVTNERISKRISGNNIGGIIFDKPTNIVLWGDVNGAFHSLVRDLQYLFQQGVINDNFEILTDAYLIFNGNVVGGSPYELETLQLVLLLLYKNPNNVFYIRGKMEQNNYWRNYNLGREIHVRMNFSLEREILVLEQCTRFFNTLPLALFITTVNDIRQVIQISSLEESNLDFDSTKLDIFSEESLRNSLLYRPINVQNNKIKTKTQLLGIFSSEPLVVTSRVVFGEPKDIVGLGLLSQKRGVNVWAILSCPTPMYQKYYSFAYDAFAILNITLDLSDSGIVFYNQNINAMSGFVKHRAISIVSGNETKKTKSHMAFGVGSTLGLSGNIKSFARMIARGIELSVKKNNLTGNLGDIWISLKINDDSFLPHKARKNIENFIQDNDIEMIVLPTGGHNLSAYYDYIKDEKILIFFPAAGDTSSRDPLYKGLIHFRASYAQEMDALIEYITKEYAVKNFLFIYENDIDGENALLMVHEALKKRGITTWKDVPWIAGSADIDTQIDIIKKSQPDVIGFLCPAVSIVNFIDQIDIDILATKVLFSYSIANAPVLKNRLKRLGLSWVFSSVVPNPATSQLDIVKKYRDDMDAYHYQYNSPSLEAYIATNILIHIAKQVQQPSMSLKFMAQKVKNTIEQFKDYEFGGFKFTFDSSTRSLLMPVWIEREDKEWLQFDNAVAMNELILSLRKDKNSQTLVPINDNKKIEALSNK